MSSFAASCLSPSELNIRQSVNHPLHVRFQPVYFSLCRVEMCGADVRSLIAFSFCAMRSVN
jgi:hypothetical protein